jgi:hypothetical protein
VRLVCRLIDVLLLLLLLLLLLYASVLGVGEWWVVVPMVLQE